MAATLHALFVFFLVISINCSAFADAPSDDDPNCRTLIGFDGDNLPSLMLSLSNRILGSDLLESKKHELKDFDVNAPELRSAIQSTLSSVQKIIKRMESENTWHSRMSAVPPSGSTAIKSAKDLLNAMNEVAIRGQNLLNDQGQMTYQKAFAFFTQAVCILDFISVEDYKTYYKDQLKIQVIIDGIGNTRFLPIDEAITHNYRRAIARLSLKIQQPFVFRYHPRTAETEQLTVNSGFVLPFFQTADSVDIATQLQAEAYGMNIVPVLSSFQQGMTPSEVFDLNLSYTQSKSQEIHSALRYDTIGFVFGDKADKARPKGLKYHYAMRTRFVEFLISKISKGADSAGVNPYVTQFLVHLFNEDGESSHPVSYVRSKFREPKMGDFKWTLTIDTLKKDFPTLNKPAQTTYLLNRLLIQWMIEFFTSETGYHDIAKHLIKVLKQPFHPSHSISEFESEGYIENAKGYFPESSPN